MHCMTFQQAANRLYNPKHLLYRPLERQVDHIKNPNFTNEIQVYG